MLQRVLTYGLCLLLLGYARAADLERIEKTITSLSTNGARLAGYEGDRFAADLIEKQLRAAGVTQIERETFEVVVPVDKGGTLELVDEGMQLDLVSLWPNLVRTNTTGEVGIEGELFYGGSGELHQLNGKPLEGGIVLLEFNSWNNWLNAASLGARAILFIAPQQTTLFEAQQKWSWTPVDIPRFWLEREQGLALKAKLGQQTLRARVRAQVDWERRSSSNIWGIVAGTDAQLKDELWAVETYYDGISVAPALTPAAESAVGAAALIELAHHLRQHPPGRSVLLLATGGHFVGQAGLKDFLNRHARKRLEFAKKIPTADSLDIDLFIALDLSSQSDQLGVWHNTYRSAYRRFFVPLGRSFMRYAEAAAQDLGRDERRAMVNGISPIKGLGWDSYVGDDIVIPDGAIAQDAGQMALSIMTVNDARLRLDTPLDLPADVVFENVLRQCDLLEGVLDRALWDSEVYGADGEELRATHDKNIIDKLADIRGELRLLPRKSTTADDPVPFGVVVLEPSFREEPWRPWVFLADRGGNYRVTGLVPDEINVQAFLLDEHSGAIIYATDLGERAQAFGKVKRTLSKAETQWVTILFAAESIEIHDRVHSHFLFTMGRNNKHLRILDKRGAAPRQYGYVLGDWMSTMMVLFGAKDDSLRVLDRSLFLLNNEGATDEESAQGRGYDLSADRMVRWGTLEFAKNMWALDEVRYQRMRKFSIENPRVQVRHEQARQLIKKAEVARDQRQWELYAKYARAALGIENMAYGDVKATQNDVISGIIFFVALLMPAAFFAERLLFASPDIRRQLIFFGLIMLVSWLILSQVHPAFKLAHPIIVLLALMILVMAFFVIGLMVNRFNAFMMEQRQRRSGTSSADISRSGTAYVAFMLGVSNMRRRVLRTVLTLSTITLLTFTVLSFTSFKPSIRFVGFEREWKPLYYGALLHDINWWWWEYSTLDHVQSHFAGHGTVVPRTWLTLGFTEQGSIPVQRDGAQVEVLALMGLTPEEPLVTGIDAALIAGSWFAEAGEESVLLPQGMAKQLGVEAEDVGQAQVTIFGKRWRVRGIFDEQRYAAIKDLNNEPLTPAKQQFAQNFIPGMEQLMMSLVDVDVDLDVSFEHLEPGRIVVLPYRALESMDAPLYSIGIRFDEEVNGEQLVQRFLSRTGFRFFVGLPTEDGEMKTLAYTSLGTTSMEGLGALFIPMLIAALIVLNTMMGAVYERFREVGVYSSVGLAPLHIAFLFIAEASVYGVLGVTIGYLIGQGMAKVLIVFDMVGGVSLNYSSSAAVVSALVVMAVVLVSAIYPARIASRMAVPDVVRRWQLPTPEGDVWRFPFPFTVNRNAIESLCGYLYTYLTGYSHESVGKLYTEKTRVVVEEQADGERIYAVQLLLWLAPFDMGVSQYLQFTVQPTEIENISGVELYIERISGPVAFWQRLNLGFMLAMRQQFLVWQTLKSDIQEEHAQTARAVAIDAVQLEGISAGVEV
jgi:hypothetical protein